MAVAKKTKTDGKITIKLVKSTVGCIEKQRRTIQALGLKKINSVAVHNDNEAIRGMIFVVKHLIEIS